MLPTLPAIPRMLSPLRSRGASHVAVLAAVATAMAVVARLESRASTADAAHAMAPGDTTVLWGPGTFVGDNITYWERFSVALFPQKQYIMHVTNGGADGCGAAIDGSVSLNRVTVVSHADVRSGATVWDRVVDVQPTDSITVNVTGVVSDGCPGPYGLTVELLQINDWSFLIYGFEQFTRSSGGSDVTFTRTFTVPSNLGAPFRLWIVNGNADGTQRLSGVTAKINGTQVVASSDITNQTVLLKRDVSLLQGSNQLQVTLPKPGAGFVRVGVTASDVTKPVLTIAAPAPGFITRDTLVAVSGMVTDQTPTTVTVNGVVAARSGNSYSASVRLATEGNNLLTVSAVDAVGNRTDSTRTVKRDTQQPVLTVNNPVTNSFTKQTSITVNGTVTDATPVTVNANGVLLPVDGAGVFTGSVPLNEGANIVTVTATDAAGNQTVVVRSVTRDTQAPVLTVTAPADGAVINADHVTVTGTVTDATTVTVTANGTSLPVATDHSFSGDVALVNGPNTIAVVATDAATNSTTISRSVTRQNLPPDPATVATSIDATVATTVFASTGFLYTGTNPIQTGVAAGAINQLRAAVVRGRALARDGSPLSGVAASILGRPEFGQTLSRADGRYDLVVNGGGPLTVALNKAGFLSAQRPVDVPWQDYLSVDDVVMIPVDGTVTTIDFANPTEVARGSVVHDTDGTRQGTLLFKQGTQATMILPDGSQQPLTSLHVRVTEYTVGPNGLRTMPAPLPPATAYTYAAEFSADEAISAGATDVRFTQALPFYLENFLGFPVGMAVPMGWYDRTRAAWIPSQNGRVVQIVSLTAGLANLDITGDGVADDATSLGVNDAERQRLALLYTTGQKLWRIPVMHFTPWDANDTQALTSGQGEPDVPPASGGGGGGGPAAGDKQNKKKDNNDPCKRPGGSIVECENQTLGETIRVTGTAFSLNYRTDRVPGRVASHELVIPLSGNTLPPGLVGIRLRVSVAGQAFEDSFPPIANQSTRFVWDGKDVYGRTVLGIQPVTVRIGYEYLPVYSVPAAGDTSFGKPGGAPLAGVDTREPNTVIRDQRTTLGGLDPRAQGFGGWTLSVHHAYDPIGGVLYMGDGTRRSALTLGQTITTVAGNGVNAESGDGGPATRASIRDPEAVLPAPDGSYYITGPFAGRVRKVGPDGIVTTVAGNGQFTSGPDSGIAVQMPLNGPWGLALAPDGSLYIAEWNASKIRRVRPDGIMTTVAGTGVFGYSGDGRPATAAGLNAPIGLAFGPGGSLYIGDAQNNRVRRIGPDGIITTVAGNGVGGFGGDGVLATNAMLNYPSGVAVSARGELYIADQDNNRVRRVSTEGIITTLAGTGTAGFSGDGGPATQAALARPEAVSVGPSGEVYIVDWDNGRVRVVTPDGTIRTVAGTGDFVSTGDGGSPLSAGMDVDWASVGPNGVMYVAEGPNNRVRAIRPTPPGLGTGEILIAAADGSEFYRFSPAGRHLSTIDAHTASTSYTFSYSPEGWLTGITDANNNVTVVERGTGGVPVAVTSPFSARTTLGVNADGFLNGVTDPAGQVVGLHYAAGGLLDTLTTPRGFKSRFTYDSVGRLTRDQGPSGEDLTLVRTELATATETQLTTAQGRTTVYHLEPVSTGALLRKTTDPAGLVSQVLVARSDSFVATAANATVTTMTLGPDPRAGMLAPIVPTVTTQTPGGRTMVVTSKRVTTRPDSTNPLSLTSQVDSMSLNGQWNVTSYTASTRHFVATSPEGRQRFATLDAKGRIIAAQTAGLDSARFTYDNLGRLSQQQVGGRLFTYSYDTRGRLLSTLDPLGRRDSLFYDGADRLIRRKLPNGQVVQFGYDTNGNLTSLTPPGRAAHGFQYTASDLRQQYDPPGIPGPKPTRYFYNRDKQVDSIVRPDSIAIRFAYDAAGRASGVTFDRGTVTFGYSPTTGNLMGMRAPTGDSLTFMYDGSLPTEVRWVGSVSGRVGVAYNNDFRVATQTLNGADAVTFGYDRDGFLRSAGALRLGWSLTSGLPFADTLGPVRGAYQYTSRGELKGYHVVRSGTTLSGTGYARDSLGRITQLFDTTQGTPTRWSYVYDSVGRFAADSVNGAIFHVFTYDANGNRLTLTSSNGTVNYGYDAQDRLLSAGTTTYSYGSNGELKTKTVPGVGTTTYTYDALGNLMTVVLPTGTRIDYVIDGQQRRVGRKVNGVLVQGWLYQNQLNPVAELDGSGNVVSRFVYGSRTNVPDYVTKNGVTYRMISDHLGSVRLAVDTATGAVAQRVDYDEWGNVSQNTNPGFQPFGFAGGLVDNSTTLVRFGARDFDPSIGRWTAKDPIGFVGGQTDLYVYVSDDPSNQADPTGLICPECLKQLGGLALSVLLDKGLFEAAALAAQNIRLGGELLGVLPRLTRSARLNEGLGSWLARSGASLQTAGRAAETASVEGAFSAGELARNAASNTSYEGLTSYLTSQTPDILGALWDSIPVLGTIRSSLKVLRACFGVENAFGL